MIPNLQRNLALMRFARYKQIYNYFMFIWIRLTENDTPLKRASCLQLPLPNQVIGHEKSICFIWVFIGPCLAALNVVGIYGHCSRDIDIKRSKAGWKCSGGDWQRQQYSFSWLLTTEWNQMYRDTISTLELQTHCMDNHYSKVTIQIRLFDQRR